jgi:GntR family transcriptional regulator
VNIDLDPQSPLPLFRQIVDQIRRLIALGALKEGDRLPTVRELAVRVRVNRNTAARAIQQLETEGFVRTRVGQGTYVASPSPRIDPRVADSEIDSALDRVLMEAHLGGVPLEELGWRLSRRIDAFKKRRGQTGAMPPPAAAEEDER